MISHKTYQQVLDGTKTQTRRPVKPGEVAQLVGDKIVAVWAPKKGAISFIDIRTLRRPVALEEPPNIFTKGYRLKWKVGKTYAVQPGRGKKAVGRIRIMKIRRERLWDIKPEDIIAEGYPIKTPGNWPGRRWWFEGIWQRLYRHPYRWEDNPEVWCPSFELAEKANGVV